MAGRCLGPLGVGSCHHPVCSGSGWTQVIAELSGDEAGGLNAWSQRQGVIGEPELRSGGKGKTVGGCRQVVKAVEVDTLGILRQAPITGPLPA